VPAALDADLQAAVAGIADRGGNVTGARAARDQRRATIDHRVPDLAMRVEAVVARTDERALERRYLVVHGPHLQRMLMRRPTIARFIAPPTEERVRSE
jgi:hypothetical protein